MPSGWIALWRCVAMPKFNEAREHPALVKFGVLNMADAATGRVYHFRITHVFLRCIFVMPILARSEVNSAPRPSRWQLSTVLAQLENGLLVSGSVQLPSELTTSWPEDSPQSVLIEEKMRLIRPLITIFDREENLGRGFTGFVRQRADQVGLPEVTVRRVLLRFWVYGGVPQLLLPMRPGPILSGQESLGLRTWKRSGRPLTIEGILARPTWSADDDDVADMARAAKRCPAGSSLQDLASAYLNHEFKTRHPEEYERFLAGEISNPCSGRLIAGRLKGYDGLSESVFQKFPSLREARAWRNLFANGPGDIYELDATGGQIFVIDPHDPSVVLGTVTIYLLIDRWSRYVVSVYATLRSPSSACVRKTLRIAFMPRERRFRNLGANVSDKDFPVGVLPLQIAVDRGPDMISKATAELAVKDLNTEIVELPPYTPDGKATVERVIDTLKTRTKARIGKGAYAKFETSPQAKAKKKRATFAACHSLRDVYAALVDVCVIYNNSPHQGLRRRLPELAAAGLEDTPKQAYLFGLKHVSGLAQNVLSTRDLDRLTLETDTATLTTKGFVWRHLLYRPANAQAHLVQRQKMRQSRRAKAGMDIKIDTDDPVDLFMRGNTDEWPRWELTDEGMAQVMARSIEEVDYFEDRDKVRMALADAEAFRRRVAADNSRTPSGTRGGAKQCHVDPQHKRQREVEESQALDAELGLSKKRRAAASPSEAQEPVFVRRTRAQRQAELDAIEAERNE